MAKCILLIDQDGTIANWTKKLTSTFEADNPGRKLRPYEEISTFYIEDCHPKEWADDIRAASMKKGHYLDLDPIDGAIEALKDIEENCLDFIDPFICTSPDVDYEDLMCHSEKIQWIQEKLGRFWTKRTILTKDKTVVRGHILIDDKPCITGSMSPTWNHLVFDQPWNQGGAPRITWKDWPSLRDNVLKHSFGDKKIFVNEAPKIIIPR